MKREHAPQGTYLYGYWRRQRSATRKNGLPVQPELDDYSTFEAHVGLQPSDDYVLANREASAGFVRDNFEWFTKAERRGRETWRQAAARGRIPLKALSRQTGLPISLLRGRLARQKPLSDPVLTKGTKTHCRLGHPRNANGKCMSCQKERSQRWMAKHPDAGERRRAQEKAGRARRRKERDEARLNELKCKYPGLIDGLTDGIKQIQAARAVTKAMVSERPARFAVSSGQRLGHLVVIAEAPAVRNPRPARMVTVQCSRPTSITGYICGQVFDALLATLLAKLRAGKTPDCGCARAEASAAKQAEQQALRLARLEQQRAKQAERTLRDSVHAAKRLEQARKIAADAKRQGGAQHVKTLRQLRAVRVVEIGDRYGHLTVVATANPEVLPNGKRMVRFRVRCDRPAPVSGVLCGQEVVVRGANLRSGNSKSCGCAKGGGAALGMSNSPEYWAWVAMRKNAGLRGEPVEAAWEASFESFFKEVGFRPTAKHLLTRVSKERGWVGGNVSWRSSDERSHLHGRTIEVDGEAITLGEASRRSGIKAGTIRARIDYQGMTPVEAVTAPL